MIEPKAVTLDYLDNLWNKYNKRFGEIYDNAPSKGYEIEKIAKLETITKQLNSILIVIRLVQYGRSL